MAVVELRNLSKNFGDVRAVNHINLTINEGEFLVLLGPSGSGKTTLMRMIAGLEKPSGGEILFSGKNVTYLPPHARKIAMVFQSYALYPHMSVFDNIAFPLKAAKTPPHQIREDVEHAAQMFNIGHLLERKPRQLSGGERQRVALARAVVRQPNVFLLDEPLSNLDAKLRATARDELKTFQRQLGVTTIYVTHDQVEAMGMGDRVVVMNLGQIHQVGTPQELYHSPADTFVATFLGSPPMNLIEQENVVIGFHPEHFIPREVADQRIPGEEVSDPVAIPFNVTRVEYLGSERFIYGTVPAYKGAKRVVASLPSLVRTPIEAGHLYEFLVDRAHLSYFDKETGRRILPVSFVIAEAL